MNPDKHHMVPVIGLAYDVMMMSHVISVLCDITTQHSITSRE